MGSSGKKKTTMAKLSRESRLRERRMDKKARKDARKLAAANGEPYPARPLDDTLEDGVPEEGVLEDGAPEDTTPENTMPENTVPENTVPEDATPEDAVPAEASVEA